MERGILNWANESDQATGAAAILFFGMESLCKFLPYIFPMLAIILSLTILLCYGGSVRTQASSSAFAAPYFPNGSCPLYYVADTFF